MKKLVSVFFVATLLLSMFSCSPKTPSDIAKAMFSDLKLAKYEQMVNYFYFDDLEESKALENRRMVESLMVDKVGKEYEKKGGIKDFTIKNETINEDESKAVVEVEIVFGNGESDETKLDFVKKGNEWYADLGK